MPKCITSNIRYFEPRNAKMLPNSHFKPHLVSNKCMNVNHTSHSHVIDLHITDTGPSQSIMDINKNPISAIIKHKKKLSEVPYISNGANMSNYSFDVGKISPFKQTRNSILPSYIHTKKTRGDTELVEDNSGRSRCHPSPHSDSEGDSKNLHTFSDYSTKTPENLSKLTPSISIPNSGGNHNNKYLTHFLTRTQPLNPTASAPLKQCNVISNNLKKMALTHDSYIKNISYTTPHKHKHKQVEKAKVIQYVMYNGSGNILSKNSNNGDYDYDYEYTCGSDCKGGKVSQTTKKPRVSSPIQKITGS